MAAGWIVLACVGYFCIVLVLCYCCGVADAVTDDADGALTILAIVFWPLVIACLPLVWIGIYVYELGERRRATHDQP